MSGPRSPAGARLRQLAMQSGAANRAPATGQARALVDATPRTDAANSRSEALSRHLSRIPREKRIASRSPSDPAALAERLGGEIAGEGLIVVRNHIPYGTPHGRQLIAPPDAASLALFASNRPCAGELCVLDTETTGLSGGTGTVPFLVGVAEFTAVALEVTQYFMTAFRSEASLLDELSQHFHERPQLLTYNGKAFDGPLLQTRYRMHGRSCPYATAHHLDLLHPVRAAATAAWPDCRLATAEVQLLGFERHDDIPGADIPQIWSAWLQRRERDQLPAVLTHNRHDLVSLALLPQTLHHAMLNPRSEPVDTAAGARAMLKLGRTRDAYHHLLSLREALDVRGARLLADLARQTGEIGIALEQWRTLGGENDPIALEQLAKHAEHAARDHPEALRLTRQLLDLDDCERYRKREERLLRKLDRQRISVSVPG